MSGATFLDQLAAYAERQDLRLATWNATQQEPGHGVALRSKVGSRELLSAESYDSVEIAAMYALDALRLLGVLVSEAGGQS